MLTNPWINVIAKETLPLRHFPVLRKIWSYSRQDSRSFPLHSLSQENFYAEKTPVYHTILLDRSMVSVLCFSPVHFQCSESRWVSCYAFFEWWLLLGLHPHCLRFKTPFDTLNINFGTLTIGSLVRVSEQHLTHCPAFLFLAANKFWVGKCTVVIRLCILYPYFTSLANKIRLY